MLRVSLVGLALGLVVAGCSDEEVAPRPELPTTPVPLWNPCDGLAPPDVSRLFATTFTTATGTPEEPRCTFTPEDDGDPALDVNYQQYAGSMDDLFHSFGQVTDGAETQVSDPTVTGADEARVVVDVVDDTLAVTGFVQNGELFQVVNAIDPAPYDRSRMAAGVRALLADLASHAAESGLS
jgi:hypothetical protein